MQHPDETELWRRYAETKDVAARNSLLELHFPMVEKSARRVGAELHKRGRVVDEDVLRSAGAKALIEAVERFNPGRSVRFQTFAEHRIRGQMLRDSRDQDGRLIRDRRIAARREAEKVFASTGERVSAQELAARGLIDANTARDAELARFVREAEESPEAAGEDGSGVGEGEVGEEFLKIVGTLPPIDRAFVLLHFVEDLDYAEIGTVLNMRAEAVEARRTSVMRRLRNEPEEAEMFA